MSETKPTTANKKNSTSASEPRYDCFKLVNEAHPKCWLEHRVGTPCSISEIEQRLGPKNHVTHTWVSGVWKKVERSER
jgi:hypothetical protein